MILLRRVAIFRDLHHIESELGFQVCGLVLRIANGLSVLSPQFGVLNGYRLVHCRMTGDVRRVVRESAQGKRILIHVATFQDQLTDEVASARVVDEVAEFMIAERVVTEILNDGSAIRVPMRLVI